MIELLLKLGPYLLALLGIVWGIFKHMQANVKIAGAAATVAKAGAQVSNEQAAEAEANTTATKAGADAATARQSIDSGIAAQQPSEVQSGLDQWRK